MKLLQKKKSKRLFLLHTVTLGRLFQVLLTVLLHTVTLGRLFQVLLTVLPLG